MSNSNDSLNFDSNSTRIIFRFCVKLQITRYYYNNSNNFKIYFPFDGNFIINATAFDNNLKYYGINVYYTTVSIRTTTTTTTSTTTTTTTSTSTTLPTTTFNSTAFYNSMTYFSSKFFQTSQSIMFSTKLQTFKDASTIYKQTATKYVEPIQQIQINTFSSIGNRNATMTPEMIKELINLLTTTNSSDLNGCLSSCSNNGLCKLNSELNQFYCECYEGFGGKSCQLDLRPCSSKTSCINNSTCKDIKLSNQFDSDGNQMYSFECTCVEHYFGDHCQSKVNLCLNKTCSNKGLCVDINNEAKCKCFKYYSGHECEIKSQDLKVIENAIKSTTVVALIVLCLFYSFFPINDILNRYIKINRNKIKIIKKRYRMNPFSSKN